MNRPSNISMIIAIGMIGILTSLSIFLGVAHIAMDNEQKILLKKIRECNADLGQARTESLAKPPCPEPETPRACPDCPRCLFEPKCPEVYVRPDAGVDAGRETGDGRD